MCFESFEVPDITIFNENERKKILKYDAYYHRFMEIFAIHF